MRSYSDLVNKHLKAYKKRSLLTIVGIISSIILFFTIGYISNYSKDVEFIDGINIFGDYDAIMFDVKREDAKKISKNIKVDNYGFYSLVDKYEIKIGNEDGVVPIYKMDKESLKDIFYERITIKEGRLPKTDKEIILTNFLKNQLNININDTFNANENLYTVVGFYEETYDLGALNLCGITNLDENKLDNTINVIIKVKNRRNKMKHIEDIVKDTGIDYGDIYNRQKMYFNSLNVEDNRIKDSYGSINFDETTLLFASLNLFVLFLTIILTYGSINISLNERKKEFATLRCIGATPSKIKHLLIKESIILGASSLLPGIIIAQVISWIIAYILSSISTDISYEALNGKIYFDVIIKTIVLIAVNIFFATIIPLRNVSKISPINNIKNTDIYNNKVRRRNSLLIRKLFGYTGELAYKNIRINNRGFIINIATLSTILIGTTCFIGYDTITDKLIKQNIDNIYDISVRFQPGTENIDKKMSMNDMIKQSDQFIEGIKDLNISQELYTSVRLESNLVIEDIILSQEDRYIYNIDSIEFKGKESIYSPAMDIFILNDEYIDRVLKDTDTNGRKIDKLGTNDFIVVNSRTKINPLKSKKENPLKLTSGEDVNIYIPSYNTQNNFEDVNPTKMNYVGMVQMRKLLGDNKFKGFSDIGIIISKDFYIQNKELIKLATNSRTSVFFDIDKNQDEETVMQKLSEYVFNNNAYFIEEKSQEIKYQNQVNVLNNLISIGLVLAILISSINLINTRYINISLREKEFRVLLSIGMKKSKLKKMIFLEGIVTWFIASIIGGTISAILLITINFIYIYQGYIDNAIISFKILIGGIFMLFIITTIINIAPYRRLKNIDLNSLTKEDE